MVSYSLWLLMLTSAPRLEFKLFCVFSEGLHSPCCLWGTSNSSSECRISRWCVYSLPDHSHKNGIALVLSLSLVRSCQSSVVCLAVYGLCSPPSDFSWHLSWSVNLSTNYAGFVNDRYSVVLWITLLLTKFLEGKMTVKHFWGSWTGFSLLLQILLHGMFFLMVQKVIWVQK